MTCALALHLLDQIDDVDAVVPRTGRGYHPLCAVYSRGCVDVVARRLAAGHLKMLDLIAELRTRAVPGEDIDRFGDRRRLLANVNTPAEYAGLEAFQGHSL